MAFQKILGSLFALLFTTTIWADVIKINPDHPEQHIVVKGDTLWDISAKFLQDPWQWPQLWGYNPQIKNPHLIYPGDILYFTIVDGQPRLSFAKGEHQQSKNHETLQPQIRESSAKDAISMIPTDAIAQFLTSPKVLDKDELANSPYVVDFAGEHIVAGAGDRAYVRAIEIPESLSYTIYRPGKAYVSPNTNEILGYEAQYIADTTIEKAGDPATLFITQSDSEIRKGDRLMVSSEGELALNFFPHPPETNIKATIISVLDGVSQIGQHNIVVIDKGTVDGLESGHLLDIYHRGAIVADKFHKDKYSAVKLPDEIAGMLLVFRPFARVSYALVLEATQAIHVLDKVETP